MSKRILGPDVPTAERFAEIYGTHMTLKDIGYEMRTLMVMRPQLDRFRMPVLRRQGDDWVCPTPIVAALIAEAAS